MFVGLQGHVAYSFRPGLWVSAGAGFGSGGESFIDGVARGDRQRTAAWAASFGYSFTRRFGVKVGYIGTRTLEDTGVDSNSLALAASLVW
jgi:hypothetical protein